MRKFGDVRSLHRLKKDNRTPLKKLAATILLVCAFATAATRADAAAPKFERRANSADVITAVLISATSTQNAVEQSDGVVKNLYAQLRTAEQRAISASRQANQSQQELRRVKAELVQIRRDQEGLMAKLAAQNVEYAANQKALREGLTGILSEGDPRVADALERYAQGEISALDDLQEVTRIIRKAREAGLRARNGANQRAVAFVYTDAWDKQKRTAIQVRMAFEEAAEVDPDNLDQWIEIASWAGVEGNLSRVESAIESALKVAKTDLERASVKHQLCDSYLKNRQLTQAASACDDAFHLAEKYEPQSPEQKTEKVRRINGIRGTFSTIRYYRGYRGKDNMSLDVLENNLSEARQILLNEKNHENYTRFANRSYSLAEYFQKIRNFENSEIYFVESVLNYEIAIKLANNNRNYSQNLAIIQQ